MKMEKRTFRRERKKEHNIIRLECVFCSQFEIIYVTKIGINSLKISFSHGKSFSYLNSVSDDITPDLHPVYLQVSNSGILLSRPD